MVKLLTANLLQSHVKGVKNGYPLGLTATETKTCSVDYDPDFLRATFGKIDYGVLKKHADACGVGADLPAAEQVHEGLLNDDGFLRKLHHGTCRLRCSLNFFLCSLLSALCACYWFLTGCV